MRRTAPRPAAPNPAVPCLRRPPVDLGPVGPVFTNKGENALTWTSLTCSSPNRITFLPWCFCVSRSQATPLRGGGRPRAEPPPPPPPPPHEAPAQAQPTPLKALPDRLAGQQARLHRRKEPPPGWAGHGRDLSHSPAQPETPFPPPLPANTLWAQCLPGPTRYAPVPPSNPTAAGPDSLVIHALRGTSPGTCFRSRGRSLDVSAQHQLEELNRGGC